MNRMGMVGSCSLLVLAATGAVVAQSSTKTYEYDALGRLVEVRTSGGQNDAEAHEICYDAAGNRTRFRATSDGSAIDCQAGSTPTPSPTPPGGTNSPPTTTNDNASGQCATTVTVNLTANDSDPENNLPLALQSITKNYGGASASVASPSSVNVTFGFSGDFSNFTYTVADSLGATSTGQLVVSTSSCGGIDPF